jgi:HKD family nuclease
MSTTKLIYNHSATNHLDYILNCFKHAEEIWLATAFLKMSGLKLILPAIKKHLKANKPITIIAGLNFGLTEPDALRLLYSLFENKVNANVFLDKAEEKTSVFHPKLSLFIKGKKGTIISGSANITKGGLITNQEVSLVSETNSTSKEWNEAIAYFNSLITLDKANPISLMLLKRYEQFYANQNEVRYDQKATPERVQSDYNFNYKKLKIYLENYRTSESKADFKQREKDYKLAEKLLDEIVTSSRLTQNRFEDIIDALVGKAGQKALWKSGSLFRNRRKVYKCKNEFRRLVIFIKENKKGVPSKVFEKAKVLVENVEGARVNYITEIMMTYQPSRFANLNSNPITVLDHEAGVYFKSHSSSFNGYDYEEYCMLLNEISQQLNLKNMLEVDSFFNEIYWEIIWKN